MDPSKCEASVLYQKIQRATSDIPVTDAFLSINIDGLFKQVLYPSFLECESEVSTPSSSLLMPPPIHHSSEGRNFRSDGDLQISESEQCVKNVQGSTFSFKSILVDATKSAHNEKSKHSHCGFRVNNVPCELNDSVEGPGEVNLKVGSQKDSTIELSAVSDDISMGNCAAKSDSLETLHNLVMMPFISHVQSERIPCQPDNGTCKNSTVSIQSTTSPVHDGIAQAEMDLRDKISKACNQCISENRTSKADRCNQREKNQSNSLKRSKTEVAPGWRKPPRPPRQTKPEANTTHRGKKLQRPCGKKKPKDETRPNLILGLALVFTFCFCVLIATSKS